ncbi:MAG TPA: hypothetical protein DER07_08930 [Armatimonadetes bacterium]|nr:hypothetical protein [Armatimonadota bacterium]
MASAYTPGLTVSADIVVRKTRRLPIKGDVLVREGDPTEPDTVIAQAKLPGILQTIKLAEKLGVEPKEAVAMFRLKPGDPIEKGQLIAETKGFFGLFKAQVHADYTGTVEQVSELTGHVLVREPPTPVNLTAYLKGHVAEVLPQEGAVIETRGAMVQGIFGVGGERSGRIRVAVPSNQDTLEASHIREDDAGAVLVGGSGVTFEALERASAVGAAGLVVGGIKDSDLVRYLGYDIGVAITGQESIPITIIVTEGFGFLAMAERTFGLLQSLEGKQASINGATQIRAGVIRPEVIVPMESLSTETPVADVAMALEIGTPIRVIREPYFGRLGKVTELPHQLVEVESGTLVRVLKARLDSGEEVMVPRANVEIIAG